MKILLLRGKGLRPLKINICKWHLISSVIALLVLIFVPQFIVVTHNRPPSEAHQSSALFKRLSILETQIQRLNNLGAYIAKQENINIESFNLSQNPALGGVQGRYIEPVSEIDSEIREAQLMKSIQQSEAFLDAQKLKLNRMSPAEYIDPVGNGYVSSNFGMRTDPINGRHRYHKGIDIAAKTGEPVSSIASGFVTFVGRKGDYGKVIEIHHSDSLKSRYAHLNSFSVKTGSVVRKGQRIATIGSTGRVTGSHLHIEIWKNGKAINPKKYIKGIIIN